MGSGSSGVWLKWDLAQVGSGSSGIWLKWGLAQVGSGSSGIWLKWDLAQVGSGSKVRSNRRAALPLLCLTPLFPARAILLQR